MLLVVCVYVQMFTLLFFPEAEKSGKTLDRTNQRSQLETEITDLKLEISELKKKITVIEALPRDNPEWSRLAALDTQLAEYLSQLVRLQSDNQQQASKPAVSQQV